MSPGAGRRRAGSRPGQAQYDLDTFVLEALYECLCSGESRDMRLLNSGPELKEPPRREVARARGLVRLRGRTAQYYKDQSGGCHAGHACHAGHNGDSVPRFEALEQPTERTGNHPLRHPEIRVR